MENLVAEPGPWDVSPQLSRGNMDKWRSSTSRPQHEAIAIQWLSSSCRMIERRCEGPTLRQMTQLPRSFPTPQAELTRRSIAVCMSSVEMKGDMERSDQWGMWNGPPGLTSKNRLLNESGSAHVAVFAILRSFFFCSSDFLDLVLS